MWSAGDEDASVIRCQAVFDSRCYGNYLLLQVCFVRRFLKTSSVVAKLRQKSAVKKGIV